MAHDSVGLFRSGKYLVIDRREHRFPDFCVYSNDAAVGGRTKVIATWVPPPMLPHSTRNEIVVAINVVNSATQRQRCELSLPVCQKCAAARRKAAKIALWIGTAIFAIGIVWTLIAAIAPYIPSSQTGMVIMSGPVLLFMAGVLSLIIAGGLRFLPKEYVALHIDKDYVWLNEISPALLAKLPEWTGPTINQIRESSGYAPIV